MEDQRLILKPISSRMDLFDDMYQKGQFKSNIPIQLEKILAESDFESLDDNELQSIKLVIDDIIEFRKLHFDYKNKFIENLNKEKQKLREKMYAELNEEKKKIISEIRSKIACKVVENKPKKQVAFESESDEDESFEEEKPKPKRKAPVKKNTKK